jgi:hypothetical protein
MTPIRVKFKKMTPQILENDDDRDKKNSQPLSTSHFVLLLVEIIFFENFPVVSKRRHGGIKSKIKL